MGLFGGCGPSAQENALQSQSMTFANILQQNYNTLFSNQLNVLNAINRSISPILAAGPNQQGFSGPQLAAYQTQAVNAAGAAATSAEQAARTYGAGQGGGGTSGLTSGITKQIQAEIGTQAAVGLGSQLNQITQADYAQGSANYWRAAGGMQALAGELSPNAAESGAGSEIGQAFGIASKVNEQNQSVMQTIGGLVGAGASFLTGGISNLGAETFGEGVGDFFKGGISNLGGG